MPAPSGNNGATGGAAEARGEGAVRTRPACVAARLRTRPREEGRRAAGRCRPRELWLFIVGFLEGAEPEGAVLGMRQGGGSGAPLPPFVWARLLRLHRRRLATAVLNCDWVSSWQQRPMARLLPWQVLTAKLSSAQRAPPAGAPPTGAGLQGGGRDAWVPRGGWLRGAGPAGRGLTRPSPVHLLFPFPRVPRADPRFLLSPPPAAAAAVVTHRAACPACPPRRGACRAGTGGRLLSAATAAMLAARPPHWGPHRTPAPRGPRASPDPGRGWVLGETVLPWEGPGEEIVSGEGRESSKREEGSWSGKAWHRRKGLTWEKASGERILVWQVL